MKILFIILSERYIITYIKVTLHYEYCILYIYIYLIHISHYKNI